MTLERCGTPAFAIARKVHGIAGVGRLRDHRLDKDAEPNSTPGRSTQGGPPRCATHRRDVHPARSAVHAWPGARRQYVAVMADSESAADLTFNRGLIDAASCLLLCSDDFAAVEGGVSNASIQAAVAETAWIVSDPPKVLDIYLAALDRSPRPTLVACRTRPRSSALVDLYSGRKAGAQADEVRARDNPDDASFARADEIKAGGRSRSQRTCLMPGKRSFACASVLPSRAVYGAAIPRYDVLTVPPRT